jgi:hypothetical protein
LRKKPGRHHVQLLPHVNALVGLSAAELKMVLAG